MLKTIHVRFTLIWWQWSQKLYSIVWDVTFFNHNFRPFPRRSWRVLFIKINFRLLSFWWLPVSNSYIYLKIPTYMEKGLSLHADCQEVDSLTGESEESTMNQINGYNIRSESFRWCCFNRSQNQTENLIAHLMADLICWLHTHWPAYLCTVSLCTATPHTQFFVLKPILLHLAIFV